MKTIIDIIVSMLQFYNSTAIYLLLGLIVAALLHLFFPDTLIRKHLGNGKIIPVIKATLFGIPIPLCSCGVLPVAAALKRQGANKGAAIAFLTSTPQIGADSFLMTYSLLGPIFAVFRIAASLMSAMIAGISVNLFVQKEKIFDTADTATEEAAHNHETENHLFDKLKRLPSYLEFEILGPIAKSLVVGMLAAGLISALVPTWVFEKGLGNPLISSLIMLVIGIPMYVCASASTPIAASLIMKGMAPGSALVFLLTGPVTNTVTMAAIGKMIGRRALAIYITTIALISLLMGFLLNSVLSNSAFKDSLRLGVHGEMLPLWAQHTGTFILTMMLLYYFFHSLNSARKKNVVQEISVSVSETTCSHCAKRQKKTP